MADVPDLGFLQAQEQQILDDIREHRASNQELARTLRALNDTLVSMGRTLSNLDRRISDSKDELQTTIRMELVGHRNVTENLIEARMREHDRNLVEEMTRLFDGRYAPKEKV